jgi:hypothetical protein
MELAGTPDWPSHRDLQEANVDQNLQSSCARLLSSEPWLLERTKFTRRRGADTVI